MTTPVRIDGPAKAPRTLLLAHGAGAPMDSPFLERIATGVAAAGIRVVRFEFPYMAARREGRRPPPDREPVLREAWRRVVEAQGRGRVTIGGKSLGGRIASLVADELGVDGLVCLGYPFHPVGKPDRLRIAHLAELRTPTRILQGTRDPFGTREEVSGYRLSPRIEIVWMEDGDHSFKPRARSGRTLEENLAAAADAVLELVRR